MTAKESLIEQINLLSSGTIANFINTARYCEIHRVAAKAMGYVATVMTEEECAAVQTMEDIAAIFHKAQKAPDFFGAKKD